MKAYTKNRNVYQLPAGRSPRRTKKTPYTFANIVLFVLICFVVVAAMQTVQINRLMADTRALGADIIEVQAQQEVIGEKIADRLASIPI